MHNQSVTRWKHDGTPNKETVIKTALSKTVRNTQREKIGKRLECSFLLSHIVLWSFKVTFVRTNTI